MLFLLFSRLGHTGILAGSLFFSAVEIVSDTFSKWQPYSPIGQTIYNTLSSSSLYEWNAHIKIYLFLEACLSILEALPPVWQICICISYLTSVWLTKEGDIRHNGSWSRNKMGGRLQSSKNPSGRSRRCWSRTCSHSSTTTLSDKHNISVAGEQTH